MSVFITDSCTCVNILFISNPRRPKIIDFLMHLCSVTLAWDWSEHLGFQISCLSGSNSLRDVGRPLPGQHGTSHISASCDDADVFACFGRLKYNRARDNSQQHIKKRNNLNQTWIYTRLLCWVSLWVLMVNVLDGDAVEVTRRFSPIFTASRAAWRLKWKATCVFWNIPSALFASVTMETMLFVSLMRQDFTDCFQWISLEVRGQIYRLFMHLYFYRIWLINNKLDVIYCFSEGKHRF